ncbi:PREDICTED: paraplegin [Ceratosolen solmsi marchali]|uniref:Paraplegin n=1 Tax=Ceratosolen solmsi marchali TaxID=326594 RepID=A0AAJ7DTF1_9HYME|nr:PREDICTED: paraplegin [Ceratosolen solmsi marchali]
MFNDAASIYITIIFIILNIYNLFQRSEIVSWNEFVYQFLAKGKVEEVIVAPEVDIVIFKVYDNAVIEGEKSIYSVYRMFVPNVIKIEEKIREAERNLGIKSELGVPIKYERSYFSNILIIILIILAALFWRFSNRLPQIREFTPKFYSHMTQAKFTLVDPLTGKGKGVHFSDVAGLREAKIEVMEFVDYLKASDNYKILGAKIPKGILLLGPPGCGKTLLAKAVATEANVPFLSMNGSEFNEIVRGLGAARIRNLFNEAKKRAPSIIYIDEIDAIGKKRSETFGSKLTPEHEQTLNQLLTEMDGMASRQDVIVLASTNRSEVLDRALLRAGRFDRHVLIDLPNLVERQEIFELHLKQINLDQDISVYSHRLATMTPKCSGADIANVCNEAALHAARTSKQKVESEDLWWAVERILNGCEKINKTILKTERRIIAYHEAGHAIAGWMLGNMENIYKVSIIERTNNTFGFGIRTAEQTLYSKEYLEDLMCTCLAGRVAETLTFNVTTTNGQNDLERVKKIAYNIVSKFGMNKSVGLIAFTEEQLSDTNRKIYSKMLGNLMDAEVRNMIAKVYKRCEKLLLENKDKLKLLAETLLEKETLTYEQVEKIIGPRNIKSKMSSTQPLPVVVPKKLIK